MLSLRLAVVFLINGVLSDSIGGNYDGYVLQEYAPSYDNYEKTDYHFSYGVSDHHTGDHKQQWEVREKGVVRGSYSLLEADGTTRIVDYVADDDGFRAVVKKIGDSIHPTAEHHGFATSSQKVVTTPIEGHTVHLQHATPVHVEHQPQYVVTAEHAQHLQPQLVVAAEHGYAEQHQHVQPQLVSVSHSAPAQEEQHLEVHPQIVSEGHNGYVAHNVQLQAATEGHQEVRPQVATEHRDHQQVITEKEFELLLQQVLKENAIAAQHAQPDHHVTQEHIQPQVAVEQSVIVPQQVQRIPEQAYIAQQQVIGEGHGQNIDWQQAQISPDAVPVRAIHQYVQGVPQQGHKIIQQQPLQIVQQPIANVQREHAPQQAIFIHNSQLSGGVQQALQAQGNHLPYYGFNRGSLYDTTSGSYGGDAKNYINSKVERVNLENYNLVLQKEGARLGEYQGNNHENVQILNAGNLNGGEIVSKGVQGLVQGHGGAAIQILNSGNERGELVSQQIYGHEGNGGYSGLSSGHADGQIVSQQIYGHGSGNGAGQIVGQQIYQQGSGSGYSGGYGGGSVQILNSGSFGQLGGDGVSEQIYGITRKNRHVSSFGAQKGAGQSSYSTSIGHGPHGSSFSSMVKSEVH